MLVVPLQNQVAQVVNEKVGIQPSGLRHYLKQTDLDLFARSGSQELIALGKVFVLVDSGPQMYKHGTIRLQYLPSLQQLRQLSIATALNLHALMSHASRLVPLAVLIPYPTVL